MPPDAQVKDQQSKNLSRLPSLTGMRIIAALMVFLFHADYDRPFTTQGVTTVFNRLFSLGGAAGVGFFFILSGFVLTWAARPADTNALFWRRRFFKIFPNHLLTWIATLVIFLSLGSALGGWRAVPSFFLLQSWFPPVNIVSAMNPVEWSLSAEFLFYLCFPFLVRGISRIRPGQLWYWAGGILGVIFVLPLIAWRLPSTPGIPWGPVGDMQGWLVYVFPVSRMLEFTLGIVMAKIVQEGRWIRLGMLPAAALAIGAYAAAWYATWLYQEVAIMVAPLALLIAAGAQADITGRRSLLRTKTMVFLGNISFAFYLWHAITLTWLHAHVASLMKDWGDAGGVAYLAVGFGITLVLSSATYRFLEVPVMRRWSSPRRKAEALPALPVTLPVPLPVPPPASAVADAGQGTAAQERRPEQVAG